MNVSGLETSRCRSGRSRGWCCSAGRSWDSGVVGGRRREGFRRQGRSQRRWMRQRKFCEEAALTARRGVLAVFGFCRYCLQKISCLLERDSQWRIRYKRLVSKASLWRAMRILLNELRPCLSRAAMVTAAEVTASASPPWRFVFNAPAFLFFMNHSAAR